MSAPDTLSDSGAPGTQPQFRYAGFWRRFVAYILDAILILILFVLLNQLVGGVYECVEPSMEIGAPFGVRCGATGLGNALYVIVSLLYFGAMESSARQATLGKMALGIAVTDQAGGRISFGRAIGRNAGKYVSAIILAIGFIMAAFTSRKQALHDIMAGCLVVKRRS